MCSADAVIAPSLPPTRLRRLLRISSCILSFPISPYRAYVKSLYKAYLVNARDWIVDRPAWRQRCIEIRAEFERNR